MLSGAAARRCCRCATSIACGASTRGVSAWCRAGSSPTASSSTRSAARRSRCSRSPKPEGTQAEHTAVSFGVDDIAATIRQLKQAGVVFEDDDLPGFRTVEHVGVLGAEKAAWFKDAEGNLLCLHEDLPPAG